MQSLKTTNKKKCSSTKGGELSTNNKKCMKNLFWKTYNYIEEVYALGTGKSNGYLQAKSTAKVTQEHNNTIEQSATNKKGLWISWMFQIVFFI